MERLKHMITNGGEEADEKHQKCDKMRKISLESCPRVRFLVKIMEKLGCKVQERFYTIANCEGNINGGFQIDDQSKPEIVLCQNHIANQEWMDRTLAHELLHAFDHCRAKVDWSNCEHHACSEVRAASLSGDCNWKYEFFRKNFNVSKQHQMCTRRRAKLSLRFNDSCEGKEEECLDKVFETCYRDTTPYREIP